MGQLSLVFGLGLEPHGPIWPLSRPFTYRQLGGAVIRWYAHAVSHNRVGSRTGRASGSVIL